MVYLRKRLRQKKSQIVQMKLTIKLDKIFAFFVFPFQVSLKLVKSLEYNVDT